MFLEDLVNIIIAIIVCNVALLFIVYKRFIDKSKYTSEQLEDLRLTERMQSSVQAEHDRKHREVMLCMINNKHELKFEGQSLPRWLYPELYKVFDMMQKLVPERSDKFDLPDLKGEFFHPEQRPDYLPSDEEIVRMSDEKTKDQRKDYIVQLRKTLYPSVIQLLIRERNETLFFKLTGARQLPSQSVVNALEEINKGYQNNHFDKEPITADEICPDLSEHEYHSPSVKEMYARLPPNVSSNPKDLNDPLAYRDGKRVDLSTEEHVEYIRNNLHPAFIEAQKGPTVDEQYSNIDTSSDSSTSASD